MTHFNEQQNKRNQRKIKETIKKVERQTKAKVRPSPPATTWVWVLLQDALEAPEGLGVSTNAEAEVWYKNDQHEIMKSSPLQTITVYNYFPDSSYDVGTFVLCAIIGGECTPIMPSCDQYPDSL